jgi:opacity protein-like surface antigen
MYNGIVRAGLHYNFTPQFGVDIVPFSRINLNNMTYKNATFQQKYSNVGLQVGFNYKL